MSESAVESSIPVPGLDIDAWLERSHVHDRTPAEILDEMLRNPIYRFRKLETLARAIDDATDGSAATRVLLERLGARRNMGVKDSWTMDRYWAQGQDGVWQLEAGVVAGDSPRISDQRVTLTAGELEMETLPDSPVEAFRRNWALMKVRPYGIVNWLRAQYIGEINAVASMEALLDVFRQQPGKVKAGLLVERIVGDERRHVELIGQLLISRGVPPVSPCGTHVLEGLDTWDGGCAIASRAEAVRAGEIRVVLSDPETPGDVKQVFSLILSEESFHERAFRRLAGAEKMLENPVFSKWCQSC